MSITNIAVVFVRTYIPTHATYYSADFCDVDLDIIVVKHVSGASMLARTNRELVMVMKKNIAGIN